MSVDKFFMGAAIAAGVFLIMRSINAQSGGWKTIDSINGIPIDHSKGVFV